MNSFLDPIFNYLDSGKLMRQPFKFLYYALGIISAIIFLFYIKNLYELTEFMNFLGTVWSIFMTIIVLLAAIFSCMFWFKRASNLDDYIPRNARFLAIPAVSHLIINLGEWVLIILGPTSFIFGLTAALIFPIASEAGGSFFFKQFMIVAVGSLVGSYIIMLICRLIGENLLAVANIANNTKKIVENTHHHHNH